MKFPITTTVEEVITLSNAANREDADSIHGLLTEGAPAACGLLVGTRNGLRMPQPGVPGQCCESHQTCHIP